MDRRERKEIRQKRLAKIEDTRKRIAFFGEMAKRSATQVYIFSDGISKQADMLIKDSADIAPRRIQAIRNNYEELGEAIKTLEADLGIFE